MEAFLQETYIYFTNNQIEFWGIIFCLICVFLNAKENIWAWPTGLVSVFCFFYVYWNASLYGDFLLQIFFMVSGFYGWYNWLYGGAKKDDLPIVKSSIKELLILGLLGVVSTVCFGYFLSNIREVIAWLVMAFNINPDYKLQDAAAYPYWDSITTVFSLIAQYQLTQKKIENWLVWIFVDFICVFIYYYKGLYFFSFLFFILLFLAGLGYYKWRKKL